MQPGALNGVEERCQTPIGVKVNVCRECDFFSTPPMPALPASARYGSPREEEIDRSRHAAALAAADFG